MTNLKQTDFFNRIFGKTPSFIQNYKIKNPPDIALDSKEDNFEEIAINEISEEEHALPQGETEGSISSPLKPSNEVASILEAISKDNEENSTPASYRDASLFFVKVDSAGNVNRFLVKRQLAASSSPLTDSLMALLKGPTEEEAKNGVISLIPKGTRLLGANIKNKVATLNFSEEILYNPVGVEGNLATLMQIVYTASSFQTVEEVQFLINGAKRDYFIGEEQWIGSPLSRSYFP